MGFIFSALLPPPQGMKALLIRLGLAVVFSNVLVAAFAVSTLCGVRSMDLVIFNIAWQTAGSRRGDMNDLAVRSGLAIAFLGAVLLYQLLQEGFLGVGSSAQLRGSGRFQADRLQG